MARHHPILSLLLCIAIGFLPAVAGSGFRPGAWYGGLVKPGWTPPGWLFGPVWMTLYLLSGVALWLLWRRAGPVAAPGAWSLFLATLLLNAAWSPIFFGLHRAGWAMIDLVGLWIALTLTIVAFVRWTGGGAALLLPYWAWVGYAGTLNFGIWWLNR